MDYINLRCSEWICWFLWYSVFFSFEQQCHVCKFSPTLALWRAQDLYYTKQHLLLTVSKITPSVETRKSSSEFITPGFEWWQMVKESEFSSCIPILATNSILNLIIILRKAELCPWFVTFTSLCLRVQCTQWSSTIQQDWMNIQKVLQDPQMKIAIEMEIDIITDTQGYFIPGFSVFHIFLKTMWNLWKKV